MIEDTATATKEESEDFLEIPPRAWLLPLPDRLRIVDDYRASYPLDGFPAEVERIVESFTSPKESKAYDARTEAFRLYYQAIQDLQKVSLIYREAVAYGKAYVLLEDSVKKTEELLQDILSGIKAVVESQTEEEAENIPPAERKLRQILQTAVEAQSRSSKTASFVRLNYDKKLREPRLTTQETEEGTIEENKNRWIEAAEEIRVNIYTVVKALKTGMQRLNYRPRAFEVQMEELLEAISGGVTSQPVLLSKRKGRTGATLTVLTKGKRFPVDEELYKTWIEAIEETKNV
jgi:gas vesicle protein